MPLRDYMILTLTAAAAIQDYFTGKVSNLLILAGWTGGVCLAAGGVPAREAALSAGMSAAGMGAAGMRAAGMGAFPFGLTGLFGMGAPYEMVTNIGTNNQNLIFVRLLVFICGAAIPLLPGLILFRFRMIGAGDIKLLSAVGGLAGPAAMPAFLGMSVLLGAVIAVLIMLFCTGFRERFAVLADFITETVTQAAPVHYRRLSERHSGGSGGEFHFTIPVLMTAILYAGGLL